MPATSPSASGSGSAGDGAERLSLRTTFHALARSPRAWLVGLAFLLRVLWIVMVPSRPVGDFALYREAAAYLLDQGRLDSEFIYMPGYVAMLAGVGALGGGLLAAKMIGVLAGTAVAWATGGIADTFFGRRAGLVATALAALWPAGIAVASVTGTDMPAAAFGVCGIYALVRLAPRRPWWAVVWCGLILGLAAWIRAVAAPLAALSLLYWLAVGTRGPVAAVRAATTLAIAFLVLLPWGLRNRAVYGELFFTDSHGGHTALVGANPNSEGAYSRSLNLMFAQGTGYRLFEPPDRHRQSDRAAYELAKSWTAFEPGYALGLIAAKADRLLTHERGLLYWPLFRQGVLDDTHRAFFSTHRTALERTADTFWWLVAGLSAAGIAVCVARRRDERSGWPYRAALSVLVFPLSLAAMYTLFFAEVRYHLAIVPLLFPYAACALDWLGSAAGHRFRGERRSVVLAASAVVILFSCWRGGLAVGTKLRAQYRWAVTVCAYPNGAATHLCTWRRGGLPAGGNSPLRGTWDGVGLRVDRSSPQAVLASARTIIPVGAGRFQVRALVSVVTKTKSLDTELAVALRADGRVIARVVWPSRADNPTLGVAGGSDSDPGLSAQPIVGIVERTGGPMLLEVEVEPGGIGSIADGGVVWVSKLIVERF